MADGSLFPKLRSQFPELSTKTDDDIISAFKQKALSQGVDNEDKIVLRLFENFGDTNDTETYSKLKNNYESSVKNREESVGKKLFGSTLAPLASGTSWMMGALSNIIDYAIPDNVSEEIPVISPGLNGLSTLRNVINEGAQESAKHWDKAQSASKNTEAEAVKANLLDSPRSFGKTEFVQKAIGEVLRMIPFMATSSLASMGATAQALKLGLTEGQALLSGALVSDGINSAVNATDDYKTIYDLLKQQHPDKSDEEISAVASSAGRKSLASNFALGLAFEASQVGRLARMSGLIPTKSTLSQAGKEVAQKALTKFGVAKEVTKNAFTEGLQEMSELMITNEVSGQPHNWKDYKETFAVGALASLPFTAAGGFTDYAQSKLNAKGVQIGEALNESSDKMSVEAIDKLDEEIGKELTARFASQELEKQATAVMEGTDVSHIEKRNNIQKQLNTTKQLSDFWREQLNNETPNTPGFEEAKKNFEQYSGELTNLGADLNELEANKVVKEQTAQPPQTLETAQGVTLPVSENTEAQTLPMQTSEEVAPVEQKSVEEISSTIDEKPVANSKLTPTAIEYVKRSIQQQENKSIPAGQDVNALYDELMPIDRDAVDAHLRSQGKSIKSFQGGNFSNPEYGKLHARLSAIIGTYQDLAKNEIDNQNRQAESAQKVITAEPNTDVKIQFTDKLEDAKRLKEEGYEIVSSATGEHIIYYKPDIVNDKFSNVVDNMRLALSGLPIRGNNGKLALSKYRELGKYLGKDIVSPMLEEAKSKIGQEYVTAYKIDLTGKGREYGYFQASEPDANGMVTLTPETKIGSNKATKSITITQDELAKLQKKDVKAEKLTGVTPKSIKKEVSQLQDAEQVGLSEEEMSYLDEMYGGDNIKSELANEMNYLSEGKHSDSRSVDVVIVSDMITEDDNSLKEGQAKNPEKRDARSVGGQDVKGDYYRGLPEALSPEAKSIRDEIANLRKENEQLSLIEKAGKPTSESYTTKLLIKRLEQENEIAKMKVVADESVESNSSIDEKAIGMQNDLAKVNRLLESIANPKKSTLSKDVNINLLKSAVDDYNTKVEKQLELHKLVPPTMFDEETKKKIADIFGSDIFTNKSDGDAINTAGNIIQKNTGGAVLQSALFPFLNQKNLEEAYANGVEELHKLRANIDGLGIKELAKINPEKAKLLAFQFALPQTLARFDKEGHFSRIFWRYNDVANLTSKNFNDVYSDDFKNNFLGLPSDMRNNIVKAAIDGNLYKSFNTVLMKEVSGKIFTEQELRDNYDFNDKEIRGYNELLNASKRNTERIINSARISGIPESEIAEMYDQIQGYIPMSRGSGEYAVKYPDIDSPSGYGFLRFETLRQAEQFRAKQIEAGKIKDNESEFEVVHNFSTNTDLHKSMSLEDLTNILDDAGIQSDITNPVVQALTKEINSRSKAGQSRIPRRGIPMEISADDYEKIFKDWAHRTSRREALLLFQPQIEQEMKMIDDNSAWKQYASRYTRTMLQSDDIGTTQKIFKVIQSITYFKNVASSLATAATNLIQPDQVGRPYFLENQFKLNNSQVNKAMNDGFLVGCDYALGGSIRENGFLSNGIHKSNPEITSSVFPEARRQDKLSRALHERTGDENLFQKILENGIGFPMGLTEQINKVRMIYSGYTLARDYIISNAKGDINLSRKLADIIELSVEQLGDIAKSTEERISEQTIPKQTSRGVVEVTETARDKARREAKSELVRKLFEGDYNQSEKQMYAQRFSYRASDEANFVYGKRNTPLYINESANIKKFLQNGYQFKTFGRSMNGFFLTSFMNGRINKQQLAWLLVGGMATAGLRGTVPYIDDIDDILYHSGIANLDEYFREFVTNPQYYDLINYGVAAGAPKEIAFDLSSKVGRNSVLPRGATKLAGELIKPLAEGRKASGRNIANATGQLATSILGGASFSNMTDMYSTFDAMWSGSDYDTWQKLLPAYAEDIIKAYHTGDKGITNNKGELIVPVDKVSDAQKWAISGGFKTQVEKDASLMARSMQFAKDAKSDINSIFTNRFVDVIQNKDSVGLQKLLKDITIWNNKQMMKKNFHLLYKPSESDVKNAILKRTVVNYQMYNSTEQMSPKALELMKKYSR